MSSPQDEQTYSGFARFSDFSARDRFVQSILANDPELSRRAFLPESQPTILFENLTRVQRDQIQAALQGIGHWFDDVQFKPMV
jgi:hypothetical protein